jgi:ABC-type antimicrobial peptide transport system permease subunit
MILKHAFRRKGRTAMTILAVAISMALLVSMLSIAAGILENAVSGIKDSKRDIIISGEGVHGIENGHELADSLLDEENVSATSPILGTDWTEFLNIKFTDSGSSEDKERAAMGIGLIPHREQAFFGDESERRLRDIFEVKFNKWFNVGGDPHYENDHNGPWTYEILIDETFANRHNLSIGDELTIENHPNNFHINGTFSTILSGEGILSRFDFGIIIMHLSELQSLMGFEESDLISSVSISLEEGHKDVDAAREIAKDIKGTYPFYGVATKEDRLDSVSSQMELARIFYTAIGSVSMIIGLLFVACIMIMSVYERTNEFGMMRAIGISKKTIFIQTLGESMMLVIIGAAIGIFIGFFSSQALGDYLRSMSGLNQQFTAYTPSLIIQALLIIIVFGTLISLYPAAKSAKKNVLDALRFIR